MKKGRNLSPSEIEARRRNGRISGGHTRGTGANYRWLKDRAGHVGAECLIWPFCKDSCKGYGVLGLYGRNQNAHTVMCAIAHGPRPSKRHFAGLSCGSDYCVHPEHVRWMNQREIALVRFGLSPMPTGKRRLAAQSIVAIRALAGTMLKTHIARRLHVSESCVRYWTGARERSRLTIPKSIMVVAADGHSLLLSVRDLVPGFLPDRDDVCQAIMLAVLDGRTTLDELRGCPDRVRALSRSTTRDNFEMSGFSLSLDVPRFDGRSWHDILTNGDHHQ